MDMEVIKNTVIEWLKVYYWDVFWYLSVVILFLSFVMAFALAIKKPNKGIKKECSEKEWEQTKLGETFEKIKNFIQRVSDKINFAKNNIKKFIDRKIKQNTEDTENKGNTEKTDGNVCDNCKHKRTYFRESEINNDKENRMLTPIRVLVLGAFLAGVSFFIPLYYERMWTANVGEDLFNTILASLQHALRVFAFDGDYREFVTELVSYRDDEHEAKFKVLGVCLYLYAPLLTLTFLMSFVKNAFAYIRYKLTPCKEIHVFSELNEKTMAMAEDIQKKGGRFYWLKCLIVFTDIIDKIEEENMELINKAIHMNAILFRKDLNSIDFNTFFMKYKERKFYLISEDEEEKIRHAENIVSKYDTPKDTLYVFSDNTGTFLLLSTLEYENIKVTRVNDVQALIYSELYFNGKYLFQRARDINVKNTSIEQNADGTSEEQTENDTSTEQNADGPKDKIISVVIVGLGRYGKEMLKALTWFCQLDGYELKINVFDSDERASDRFSALCPELMAAKYNGNTNKNDARYSIKIHAGVDVFSNVFYKKLRTIDDATFVFVSLGDDNINLTISERIRTLYQGAKLITEQKPDIETVVYSTELSKNMGTSWQCLTCDEKNKSKIGAINHKKQQYNIITIGDLDSLYSINTLINSDISDKGCKIHLRWSEVIRIQNCRKIKSSSKKSVYQADEETEIKNFWRHEYMFRSSVAKALHEKLRDDMNLKLPRFDNIWGDFKRYYDELDSYSVMKHYHTEKINWEYPVLEVFKNIRNNTKCPYYYWSLTNKYREEKKSIHIDEYNAPKSEKELDLVVERLLRIGFAEHLRWNAYMRTEGYEKGDKTDALAKRHVNLVSTEKLSFSDLIKDAI